MIYLSLIAFIVLTGTLYKKTLHFALKPHFFPALLIKISAGAAVGLLYVHYYHEGDTIAYDSAARLVLAQLKASPDHWISFLFSTDISWFGNDVPHVLAEPRSRFFVKILSLLYLWTGRSYWVAGLYLSLFSFAGAWLTSHYVGRYYKEYRPAVLIAFLYFPSVVFWSSGVLKESVAFPCILLIFTLFLTGQRQTKINTLIYPAGLLLLIILWKVKYHYAAIIFLIVIVSMMYNFIQKRRHGSENFWLYTLLLLFTGLLLSFIHPNFHFDRILTVLSDNQQALRDISSPDNLIPFIDLESGVLQFIINAPVALFGGLFMPLPWQGSGWFTPLAGLMNFTILVFFIFKIRALKGNGFHGVNSYAIFYYITITAVLIAYSTPNFGTLERYKTGYLPFFLLWLFAENPLAERIKNKVFIYK